MKTKSTSFVDTPDVGSRRKEKRGVQSGLKVSGLSNCNNEVVTG